MTSEQTVLSPAEELRFRRWATVNSISDVDAPDAHYDYRGFWKATQGASHAPGSEQHFPDTFKQHGHPTFSTESQYSKGPNDGGRWAGDRFVPAGSDLLATSQRPADASGLADALKLLAQRLGGQFGSLVEVRQRRQQHDEEGRSGAE